MFFFFGYSADTSSAHNFSLFFVNFLLCSIFSFWLAPLTNECQDCVNERNSIIHRNLRRRMVWCDGRQRHATWGHHCRNYSGSTSTIRRFLVQLHDCPVVLDHSRQWHSNRPYCVDLLVRFWHRSQTRTIHFHWVAANLDDHNRRNCIYVPMSICNEHFRALFSAWWTRFPEIFRHRVNGHILNFSWSTQRIFTCGVSSETASIQCLRQMFRASNQSTSKLRVGWCSQLKKYEWATPRASLYVEWRTPARGKKANERIHREIWEEIIRTR